MTEQMGLLTEPNESEYAASANEPESSASALAGEASHDLPSAPPLSHSLFLAEDFDTDVFLCSRRHASSLDELRAELRQYLAELRNELVGVINEDYEDFIGLGIGLRGTDRRLERMRRPVENVRVQIEATRSELVEMQTAIQAKLDERSAVREQKATVRLLLSINDSVLKVEALLLIESPPENDQPIASTSNLEHTRQSVAASKRLSKHVVIDKPHGTGAKRVERVAAEYNQLLYLMEKAEGLAFVKTLQKHVQRVEQIRRTLQRDMANLLSNALHAPSPSSDSLFDILRIFHATRKVSEAEDVVRKELIRPWLQKHVTREALAGPQSPIVPVTPKIAQTPRSPSLSNDFQPNGIAKQAFEPILPDASGHADALIEVYNKILSFVSRECVPILDAADRRLRLSLLVSVVWEEILSRLISELGSYIFAAGRADIFHANYVATSALFARFEGLCITPKQVTSLRACSATEAFQRRWQRPIYFQLRFKEIVTRLEDALDARAGLDVRAQDSSVFLLAATEATHRAMWTCWQPEVVLPELYPRFWRLSLQLLSRYKRWLDDVMPSYLPGSRRASLDAPRDVSSRLTPASSAAPSRPITPQEMPEEVVVRHLTLIIADTKRLEDHAKELFATTIRPLLSTGSDADTLPSAALDAAAASISNVASSLVTQIVASLVRQCNEPLRPSLRSVVSEVRASSRPAPPSSPSHLVPRVLKPLKAYFETFPGKALDNSFKKQIAGDVLDEIALRYASVLNDNREAEASLRRLKKGRQGFSLFGRSAAADESAGAEEGNVKIQLQLDATAFSDEAEALGVAVDEAKGFAALRQAVQ